MKKFSALAIAFSMLCCSAPVNASAIQLNNNSDFAYNTYFDHIEITGFQSNDPANHASESIQIPSKINGLPVTVIGQSAFFGEQFSEIALPDTIQIIQDKAQACVGRTHRTTHSPAAVGVGNRNDLRAGIDFPYWICTHCLLPRGQFVECVFDACQGRRGPVGVANGLQQYHHPGDCTPHHGMGNQLGG